MKPSVDMPSHLFVPELLGEAAEQGGVGLLHDGAPDLVGPVLLENRGEPGGGVGSVYHEVLVERFRCHVHVSEDGHGGMCV